MHRLGLLLPLLPLSIGCVRSRAVQPVPGTYAVWLCAASCTVTDTASAAVAGYLVLNATPFPPATVESGALGESIFTGMEERTPNACFILETRRREMLAGIIRRGVTTWSTRGDTVSVVLYASPDAFHTLYAVAKNGRLLGRGRDSGFIGTSFDDWTGPAHGTRVGAADAGRCEAPSPSSR